MGAGVDDLRRLGDQQAQVGRLGELRHGRLESGGPFGPCRVGDLQTSPLPENSEGEHLSLYLAAWLIQLKRGRSGYLGLPRRCEA